MFLKKIVSKSCTSLSALVVIATVAGCGGGGSTPPDPLQAYREQTLKWAACDPNVAGPRTPKVLEAWENAGDRLQCSTMRVPMDWAKPERSDLVVAVMRLVSSDPAQRRGALVFNPGGPGNDGQTFALKFFSAFGLSNPASAQGALQLRLLATYDMVGFSPRGVGASSQLQCATNEIKRPIVPLSMGNLAATLANADYNDRKAAEACLKNPVAPFINTEATARDMDLLRELLGDAKLNYFGTSYGTWLGTWYANLFPDKVGRMVLDSAVDYSSPFQSTFFNQPLARQTLNDEVFLPYAARHSDHFQLGSNTADIAAMVNGLSPQLRGVIGILLSEQVYTRGSEDVYLATLSAAQWVDQTLASLPDPSSNAAWEAALRAKVFVANDSVRNEIVGKQAVALIKAYLYTFWNTAPGSIQLDASGATYWAVICNDDVAITDPLVWHTKLLGIAQRAPLHTNTENLCVYWGGPRVAKPSLAGMKGLDVLMVQSQYDAATATVGANQFFAQLPNARRVYVPGEYAHGVFPYSDTCVDSTVVRYLLGETPTVRETACVAHPLTQDAAALQAKAQRQGAMGGVGLQPPTYLRPKEAQEMIDSLMEGIR